MPPLAALGLIQGVGGALQTFFGNRQAKRAQRDLENLQTPTTTSSATINDYLNKASASPYDSLLYKNQKQNIGRGTATGLTALQNRRSALAGVTDLVRAQNDAQLKAAATAEQQQFGRLADATRLKAADDERVFNINKMLPYQKQLSLLSSKAMGGNQTMNAGLSNLFNAFGTTAMGFSGFGNKNINE